MEIHFGLLLLLLIVKVDLSVSAFPPFSWSAGPQPCIAKGEKVGGVDLSLWLQAYPYFPGSKPH